MSTAAFDGRGDAVIGAWETMGQVVAARLPADRGQTVTTAPMPGEATNRKHPSVAVAADGSFAVAWAEGTGWNRGGAVAWQVFDADLTAAGDAAGRADGLAV